MPLLVLVPSDWQQGIHQHSCVCERMEFSVSHVQYGNRKYYQIFLVLRTNGSFGWSDWLLAFTTLNSFSFQYFISIHCNCTQLKQIASSAYDRNVYIRCILHHHCATIASFFSFAWQHCRLVSRTVSNPVRAVISLLEIPPTFPSTWNSNGFSAIGVFHTIDQLIFNELKLWLNNKRNFPKSLNRSQCHFLFYHKKDC